MRKDYTYTIGVNSGQSAANGATVTDVLPSGVTLLGATTTRGTCSGTTTVVCKLGDLPAGDLEKIILTVHTTGAGVQSNTATLTVSNVDTNPDNNTSTVDTQVFNPCTAPGAVIATDPTGDATGTPQQDLSSVAVAEPYAGANGKLVFTMKVQNLDPLPQPSSFWYEHFSYGGVSYFVDMETDSSTTKAPLFHYGRYDVDPTSGLNTQSVLGAADSGTWSPDGTITISLSTSKLTQVANPDDPRRGRRRRRARCSPGSTRRRGRSSVSCSLSSTRRAAAATRCRAPTSAHRTRGPRQHSPRRRRAACRR